MNKDEFNKIIEHEGDYESGLVFGLPFVLWRHPELKHWCGYVGVPKGSRLDGENYYISTESELGLSPLEEAINNIEVHGGLTAAGKLGQKRGKKDVHYFGFDCAHSGDLVAYMLDEKYSATLGEGATYKTKEYAMEEVTSLARQLKEIIDLGL